MHLTRIIATTLICSLWLPVNSADHPVEVEKFLELRESCDHWRGESGYDKERQADIDWSICQSCQGTDTELARLKKKYSANAKVMDALHVFEPKIEPNNKAAAKRLCKTTRKPKWQR